MRWVTVVSRVAAEVGNGFPTSAHEEVFRATVREYLPVVLGASDDEFNAFVESVASEVRGDKKYLPQVLRVLAERTQIAPVSPSAAFGAERTYEYRLVVDCDDLFEVVIGYKVGRDEWGRQSFHEPTPIRYRKVTVLSPMQRAGLDLVRARRLAEAKLQMSR